MQPQTEQKANKLIAGLFERLQEHHKLHGQAERDDALIWETFDACKKELGISVLQGITSLAKQHAQYSLEQRLWSEEKLEMDNFRFRGRSAKWKTSEQNRMIWKTLMHLYEVVSENIRPNPGRDLFV
jgi:hypothetical protein